MPGRTVHVVIDDQNDFLHPDGWYAKHDIDISHMRRVIEPTKELNEACRRRGVPDRLDAPRHPRRRGWRPLHGASASLLREGGLRIGTWGFEILDELDARPEDWYVAKTRLSAFFQTNLEQVLRALGAETVLITGVLPTSASARPARTRCSATSSRSWSRSASARRTPHLHEPAMEMIRVGWGQVNTLAQTLDELRALPRRRRD